MLTRVRTDVMFLSVAPSGTYIPGGLPPGIFYFFWFFFLKLDFPLLVWD